MSYDYITADPMWYSMLKQFAYENRNHQTDAERLLWWRLSDNKLGLHFRRRHIIGCYIADFVCLKAKTIIEIDGGYHSQSDQIIKDYWRTEDLNKFGFHVVRFRNEEVFTDLPNVLDKIYDIIVHRI